MQGRVTSRDMALRRAVYAEYAKATACVELGGDMLPEALRLGREALRLSEGIEKPTQEDRQLRRELRALLAAEGRK